MFRRYLLIIIFLSFSSVCFAAKPKSIKYVEELFSGENITYEHYVVTCSDDSQYDMSAWDGKKQWCEGKGTKSVCNAKKIKTAKQLCKKS